MPETPIYFEPADPPELPVVAVPAEAFDAIAAEAGAVLVGNATVPTAVRLRGVEYVLREVTA